MKHQYEDRTRFMLPRRTYTIVRVDGRAFHHYCRGLERPFDAVFAQNMDLTAMAMCGVMQGARLAFVQSDEISVLLTDFASPDTEAWFDGNIQKIVSIAASEATRDFNYAREDHRATFDARAFTIPDPVEVENYFIWRQKDATRNSVSMAAQAVFSHKQLQGVSTEAMQEMLFTEKGINWNDYPEGFKRGRVVVREQRAEALRPSWAIKEPPVFTQDREFLRSLIPRFDLD